MYSMTFFKSRTDELQPAIVCVCITFFSCALLIGLLAMAAANGDDGHSQLGIFMSMNACITICKHVNVSCDGYVCVCVRAD